MIKNNSDISTRDKLVRSAAYLMHRRGYHGVGLTEILRLAKAPKGVLYYHFPKGKPQLAEAAIELSASIFADQIKEVGEAAKTRQNFINGLAELTVSDLISTAFTAGCPLTTIALETAPADPALSLACETGFKLWIDVMAGYLSQFGEAEARKEAEFILSTLEGAMMIARSRKDASIIYETAARIAEMP